MDIEERKLTWTGGLAVRDLHGVPEEGRRWQAKHVVLVAVKYTSLSDHRSHAILLSLFFSPPLFFGCGCLLCLVEDVGCDLSEPPTISKI